MHIPAGPEAATLLIAGPGVAAHAVIDTNLNGTWNMCITAGKKYMLRHGGRIVNIVADMWKGFPGMVHTGAARAAPCVQPADVSS